MQKVRDHNLQASARLRKDFTAAENTTHFHNRNAARILHVLCTVSIHICNNANCVFAVLQNPKHCRLCFLQSAQQFLKACEGLC